MRASVMMHLPGLVIRRRAVPQQACGPLPEPQGKRPEAAAPVARPHPAGAIQPNPGNNAVQVSPPLPVKDAGAARGLERICLSLNPVPFPYCQGAFPATGGNCVQPPGAIRAEQNGLSGNGVNGTLHGDSPSRLYGNIPVFPVIRQQMHGRPHRQGNGQQAHGRGPEQAGQ